jgi:transposase-like protein
VKKARKFSTHSKIEAVRRMAEATTIVGLAEELGIRRKLLSSGEINYRPKARLAWRDA